MELKDKMQSCTLKIKDYCYRVKIERFCVQAETVEAAAVYDLVYVKKPVEQWHRMNLFFPKEYLEDGCVNGYTAKTAPIFMPNEVGGYMPASAAIPGLRRHGEEANSLFEALKRGYVVASPALRGRTLKDEDGRNFGKAPACIVDYKAAVRFLRELGESIPGDKEKIITNGTSAGGALSSLMGATGNAQDYQPWLEEIGAYDQRDDVFAASCYCPITNLDHADMAYEWQFDGIYEFQRKHMKKGEGNRPDFEMIDGQLSAEQIELSKKLSAAFPAYVNSLKLVEDGQILTLDENGEGSFKEALKKEILASCRRAMEKGESMEKEEWVTIQDGKAAAMDFSAYARTITRMKTAPAFDDVMENSPENSLFGNESEDARHFTAFAAENSHGNGEMAEDTLIKMMNPMEYILNRQGDQAHFWRIRHGEIDRDTGLAVSKILQLKLTEMGCEVDYHIPWHTPHSGDYDLKELFDWIDKIVKTVK